MPDSERLLLQTELESILGSDQVFFQPPDNVSLTYPCIVYSWSKGSTMHADSRPYLFVPLYDITVIEKDPECPISVRVGKTLRGASYDRGWIIDNLYHNNFVVNFTKE